MSGGLGTDGKIPTPGDPRVAGPVSFDPDLCFGCNVCIDVCQVDIMLPNPEEGMPPVIAFPGECWYDGSCVAACPMPGAITLNQMAKNSVRFRRKETGEDYFT